MGGRLLTVVLLNDTVKLNSTQYIIKEDKMENREILGHIDYTVLKANTDWKTVNDLCQNAIKYQTASVCIPPNYVAEVKKLFDEKLVICTVIGFPLGYSTTNTKVFEAKQAVLEGAQEIDMVINIADVKNHRYDKVLNEIVAIKEAIGDHILKVIIEICYLTTEEKIKMCEIVSAAKAEYIKTSTGFGTSGATFEDIILISKHIDKSVKIKASGGIRTREDMIQYIQLGCDRIGASSIEIFEITSHLNYVLVHF
jgi:deoxyribose-phosphate aldolase